MGVCGTAGQPCTPSAACCTAAQGGKNYSCNQFGQCDIGAPGGTASAPPDTCLTSADCAGSYPCRNGYCHWPDGTQPDGGWCLDGQECSSGICTSTAAGTPGTCCSGVGTGCAAGGGTICCAPYACTGTAGAQYCGQPPPLSCLDFTNSGPQGTTQCTTYAQCCVNRNLTCTQGECCTLRSYPCTPGSGGTECCFGDTCGNVTSGPSIGTVCCGDYGAFCSAAAACCDGFICTSGVCLKSPGMTCTGPGQCAQYEGCKIETPPAGVCCSHDMGVCKSNADCCSGSCDTVFTGCNWAQEYGQCLDNSDCASSAFGLWVGTVCGGNANVGPFRCCPVPGDRCNSAADCCEGGDSCKAPLSGADTTTPLCCREAQAACTRHSECCTGICDSTYSHACCAYPYMTTFTCRSDADCCGAAPYGSSTRCDAGVTNRCCFIDSRSCPGAGKQAQCCTGKVDNMGCCTLH